MTSPLFIRSEFIRYVFIRVAFLLSLCSMASLSQADIYKWTDAEGNLVYGDAPPAGIAAERVKKTPAFKQPPPTTQTSTGHESIKAYLEKLEAAKSQQRPSPEPAAQQSQSQSQKVNGSGQTPSTASKEYDNNPFDGTEARKLSEQKEYIRTRNKEALSDDNSIGPSKTKTLSEKKAAANSHQNQ